METKEMKKDFSSLGMRLFIGAIIITAVQLIGQMIVLAINPLWAANFDIVIASTMIPMYVIGLPLTLLLVGKGDRREINQHSMTAGQLVIAFFMCYGLLQVGNFAGMGVTGIIALIKGEEVTNVLVSMVTGGNIWITAIYTVICAPIFEELLFRKLVCSRTVKYGQGVAVVVSGLTFGLFHGNFNQFFYAFLMGAFLAFIYVKTGNIKYTIGLHMVVNFVGSVVSVLVMNYAGTEGVGYIAYSMILLVVAIVGIVLLIVKRKSFHLEAGEVTIEKGSRFKTVILNVGMILNSLLWIVVMFVQAIAM